MVGPSQSSHLIQERPQATPRKTATRPSISPDAVPTLESQSLADSLAFDQGKETWTRLVRTGQRENAVDPRPGQRTDVSDVGGAEPRTEVKAVRRTASLQRLAKTRSRPDQGNCSMSSPRLDRLPGRVMLTICMVLHNSPSQFAIDDIMHHDCHPDPVGQDVGLSPLAKD